ncbi:MAG: MOSC domain-containing protein [Proteobacteria bacterium]|nr:MOSC domain-containing protein [Pseudomonadota bacterium]
MRVVAVHANEGHAFSKAPRAAVRLVAGEGVEGDAHRGVTVKHRSRVAVDPSQPNLRQIHLLHAELFEELRLKGFEIRPGDLGENITTAGMDLLGLPRGALLQIGEAIIEITGLRNPCAQIDAFRPGLLKAVLDRDSAGNLIRKAGVMGIVHKGGLVSPQDGVALTLPPEPYQKLDRV